MTAAAAAHRGEPAIDLRRCPTRAEGRKLGDRVGQLGEWIDQIQLAGFNDGSNGRPVVGAEVVAGKERILALM